MAGRLARRRAPGLDHAGFWNEEQIKPYVPLLWLLHAGGFLLGLLQPSLR